jgi:protoheme IX farnesyltransferase
MSSRWAKLAKLELSALVVVTSSGGYIFTGGSLFDIGTFAGLLVGTTLSAASASTFNQIKERHFDSIMQRTRTRPLVANTISLQAAKMFGWATGVGGVGLLYATTNPTTSLLSLLTILTYTHIYTPLKRKTRFNTEIGALVGAIPPVMGWTAAMGSSGILTPEAMFLALTLYTWQMHHFMTIAWSSRRDYARAGFIMQSLDDPDGAKTVRKGMFWAVSMLPLPFLSTALHFTNPMFIITGTAINAYLIREYYKFYKDRTTRDAKRARYAGFLQLLAFFAFLAFHLESREHIKAFQQLNKMRQDGLNYCVYHYHKVMSTSHLCIYLFGKKKDISKGDAEQTKEQPESLN